MLCLLSTPIFFTLISLFAALTAGQIRNNTHGPGYYVQSNNGGTPDFLLVRGGQDNKIYSDVFLCTNNFLQGDCRVVALEWGLQGCLTLQPEMQNSINSWAFPLQVTKAVGAEQCRTYAAAQMLLQCQIQATTLKMNPHQQNKVDISVRSLSPDEQRLFRLYGKLPNKKDLLQNKLKERKYFDSGDYALSKAGKASDIGVTQIGREHPVPENIPHSSTSPANGHHGSISSASPGTVPAGLLGRGASPVKEGGSFLHRETSASDMEPEDSEPKSEETLEEGSEHARLKPVAISQ
ncbi:hypothetical protein EG328_011405 [Venturia inaequalis]|uniref:mRNA stability protein n=1 Tax=Venturia inaequalis TaxID=5025 RepID=A0A8H3V2E6_VENIN|nr:hypothetical protein EG328_011405 [Venturia inaequalis]